MTDYDPERAARPFVKPQFENLPHMRAMIGVEVSDTSQDGIIRDLDRQYGNRSADPRNQVKALRWLHKEISKHLRRNTKTISDF